MPLIRRAWLALRWYVPPVLLAVQPIVVVLGANLGRVPVRGIVMARALLVSAAAAVLLAWILRVVQRDAGARAAWLSWFLMLCNLYGASAAGLRSLGLRIEASDPLFAVPYVVTAAVIAAIASRPWEARAREPLPLTMAAVLLLLVGVAPALGQGIRPQRYWQLPADQLVASTLSRPLKAPATPPRDIYYVVLDGLGRSDTLHRSYNLDLRPVIEALEQRGFYVARSARSNYSQTYLSLASTLNMDYLDPVVNALLPGTTTLDPLGYLIQDNALMRMASRAGYRVVAIGSEYPATRRFDRADLCVCSLRGLDEVEAAAIAMTPLAAVPLPVGDPYAAHGRRIMEAFDSLEAFTQESASTFVFAHVLAPHAPFVLARDGSPLARAARPFTYTEAVANMSDEEYAYGYGEQTRYVLDRMLRVVDTALSRPGPKPVVVIHGDHGPTVRLPNDRVSEKAVTERMEIFAAYLFPDAEDALYPTITPVNAARLLARHYFGVDLPLLPDRAMFSPVGHPYRLTPVPERTQ
jgi:hypothetical protein